MKTCTKCREDKPLDQFMKRSASKDGFTARCKLCLKADNHQYFLDNRERCYRHSERFRTNNRSKTRQYIRNHYERNRDHLLKQAAERYDIDKVREYRKNNKERINQYLLDNRKQISLRQKQYRINNSDKIKKQQREYYYNNKERLLANLKQWNVTNAGSKNAHTAKRKARLLNATPKWLTAEQMKQIEDIYKLAYEQGKAVDHIIPLQGKVVCGLHVPWNLQLLSKSENSAKSNRLSDS